MPLHEDDHRRDGGGGAAVSELQRPSSAESPPPKQSPRLLSLLLKAIIMTLITALFFLFLGLAAIILLHLCLAGGLLHRRRQIDHLPSPGSGAMPPRDLKRLPKFKYHLKRLGQDQSQASGSSSGDCAVCLDEFKQGQWCRKLVGCGHVFHKGCVDDWLVKVAACPLCRARVQAHVGSSRPSMDDRDCQRLWGLR